VSVSLRNTQVTQKGVDGLKRALPHAEIWWNPLPVPAAPPTSGK
jgi:hypothetical protein